jgi:hypothetical protein
VDRDATLDFFIRVVADGPTGFDFLGLGNGLSVEKKLFNESGLTRSGVADDGDVPEAADIGQHAGSPLEPSLNPAQEAVNERILFLIL